MAYWCVFLALSIYVHVSDNVSAFWVSVLSLAFILGKQCMGLVDLDRAWAAEEHNYSVQVISMEPESCSPKNNMFVGIPT